MMSDRIQGKITSGLAPHTTVLKTLQFVKTQLPNWRDDPDRPSATGEVALNGQLCKFLNLAARRENFSMALFHHEEPQTGRRLVDLSAFPLSSTMIEGRTYNTYTPILVLECKRLPAPSNDREREYVTGGGKKSGGIQRFKLGLHGSKLSHAGMIGYVQQDTFDNWFTAINVWIDELATSSSEWSTSDLLKELNSVSSNGTATCTSIHNRVNSENEQIHLTHLWVDLC